MNTPPAPGTHPGTPAVPTRPAAHLALAGAALLPAAAVAAVLPGRALLALAVLALFAAAVTRTGLWVVGDRTGRAATVLAARTGGIAALAGLGLAGLALLLGPATVDVLAGLILVGVLYRWVTR
ncbi:MAG: hypothetical protein L0I76_17950 [Pseudonocardia sp.]|nr:hypothetical protein [Pseudonocardia sp.]